MRRISRIEGKQVTLDGQVGTMLHGFEDNHYRFISRGENRNITGLVVSRKNLLINDDPHRPTDLTYQERELPPFAYGKESPRGNRESYLRGEQQYSLADEALQNIGL